MLKLDDTSIDFIIIIIIIILHVKHEKLPIPTVLILFLILGKIQDGDHVLVTSQVSSSAWSPIKYALSCWED